jgi:hypothetical protein
MFAKIAAILLLLLAFFVARDFIGYQRYAERMNPATNLHEYHFACGMLDAAPDLAERSQANRDITEPCITEGEAY